MRLLVILCAPRSYSSVVGAMLGQHPGAYGMPELNLFMADRIDDLVDLHRRTRPTALDGLLRSLAQLHNGNQSEESVQDALVWLDQRSAWGTDQVLQHLAGQVSPRLVVEKSPRTGMREENIDRVLHAVPNALFLHLTRHPRSMGTSLLNVMQRGREEWGSKFDPERVDPEKIWLRINMVARNLQARLPEGQYLRVRGEDIMANPRLYLSQIAEWLELDTDANAIESMMHPENSPYACLGPESARYGNDPNFLEHPAFRAHKKEVVLPSLTAPPEWAPHREFEHDTIKLAREFGYR